jgi:hypothetical protein
MRPYNNDGIKEKRPREALVKACRLRKLRRLSADGSWLRNKSLRVFVQVFLIFDIRTNTTYNVLLLDSLWTEYININMRLYTVLRLYRINIINHQVSPTTRFNQPAGSTKHQVPPTTRFHQPPGSTNHQVPPTARFHQPAGLISHYDPPTTRFHQPPGSTNYQVPPTTRFHQPPGSTNHQV